MEYRPASAPLFRAYPSTLDIPNTNVEPQPIVIPQPVPTATQQTRARHVSPSPSSSSYQSLSSGLQTPISEPQTPPTDTRPVEPPPTDTRPAQPPPTDTRRIEQQKILNELLLPPTQLGRYDSVLRNFTFSLKLYQI